MKTKKNRIDRIHRKHRKKYTRRTKCRKGGWFKLLRRKQKTHKHSPSLASSKNHDSPSEIASPRVKNPGKSLFISIDDKSHNNDSVKKITKREAKKIRKKEHKEREKRKHEYEKRKREHEQKVKEKHEERKREHKRKEKEKYDQILRNMLG